MKRFNVAVIDATDIVGQEVVKILEQRKFPVASIQLLSPHHSSGVRIPFNRRRIEVREAKTGTFRDVDIAFFCTGSDVSRRLAPLAVKAGATVIDSSSAFRMNPKVPLVVPEVNPGDIEWHNGVIASPKCSTIQMVVALHSLHEANPVRRVIVSTYESVSSSGSAALKEMTNQARFVLEGRRICPHVYSHQIAFNVLPEIGVYLDNGYTREEQRMAEETRKILHVGDMAISATCVRVPVWFGHSEAVNVEFSSPITPEEAKKILAQAAGVRVLDDPTVSFYPQPWAASGSDHVFVGRIRRDVSHPSGLVMWIVADNVRKGAALNVVQIAEEAIARGWICARESVASLNE